MKLEAAQADLSRAPMVLSVAFPYAPIGETAVGGAEVICTQMETALAGCGFASAVVAQAGSTPRGKLYPTVVPPGLITDEVREQVEASQQANIDRALRENDIALVHMHGLDFSRYSVPDDMPVVVTLHLPPAWYPERIWHLPQNYHLVCVSESQRRACPVSAQERVLVINNGVALPCASVLRPEGKYALMLARICAEKNLHVGFDAARAAGMPIILGGETFAYEAHQRYLHEQIMPRLSREGHEHDKRHPAQAGGAKARFVGPVSGENKQRLLTRAACLLLPSLAPETSSLVAMEALAAGVPVVAMAVGAVPELVEDGRTGVLIQPGDGATDEMTAALLRVSALDRKACREAAEARFPLSRMVESYCELYRQVARPARRSRQIVNNDQGSAETAQAVELTNASASLLVESIEREEALQALVPEWEQLWAADRGATPFQHPAWLLPWWRQFGPDGELRSFALREESRGQLVGFAPLYLYTPPETEQRQLLLIGAGTTDYLDGLWGSSPERAGSAALHHVINGMASWSEVSLHQLRAGSPLFVAAQHSALPLVSAEPCSSLLTQTELPSKVRMNLRRYRRAAAARGSLRCELATTAAEADCMFSALVDLHSRRWRDRGEEGVLRDERVLAHHRDSLPLLLEAGLLRLFHLTLNGETLGVLYGLADGPQAADRRLYLYLIGFDAKFAALSPGGLLLEEAWLYAREHGFNNVDLLRGGEAYKQLWGAEVQATYALQFGRETA